MPKMPKPHLHKQPVFRTLWLLRSSQKPQMLPLLYTSPRLERFSKCKTRMGRKPSVDLIRQKLYQVYLSRSSWPYLQRGMKKEKSDNDKKKLAVLKKKRDELITQANYYLTASKFSDMHQKSLNSSKGMEMFKMVEFFKSFNELKSDVEMTFKNNKILPIQNVEEGGKYIGNFFNDRAEGKGQILYPEKKVIYKNEWTRNRKMHSGIVEHIDPDNPSPFASKRLKTAEDKEVDLIRVNQHQPASKEIIEINETDSNVESLNPPNLPSSTSPSLPQPSSPTPKTTPPPPSANKEIIILDL